MTKRSWTADNGDGTYTNPLFYEEFSDPDIIRVGDDFYMAGTTMHTMPGLPLLHSRDLVNWELLSYAVDLLDLGPAFRLEGGEIYGQGIWAPCLRYRDGVFHIFSNVNGHRTQVFTATDPRGPWTRQSMKVSLHDLSVLFDDDGRAFVVWGYKALALAELTPDLLDIVPGSERTITDEQSGMGEGCHFCKIDGTYLITSAWYEGRMRMPAARAKSLDGPWEVHQALSADEAFGLHEGYRLRGAQPPFQVTPPNVVDGGRMSLHQGGIVDTPGGEWWGFSMMDFNSLGRLTALSPVTWQDGWPYFGLPGNLGRTPRVWVKPNVAEPHEPRSLFVRDDGFEGPALNPVWQWNHVPVADKWSLTERPGHLRLHALQASSFLAARNTLTQRAMGPVSSPSVTLDGSGLGEGDVAGLALLGLPFRWIGLRRRGEEWRIVWHDQQTGRTLEVAAPGPVVRLRADCNFLSEQASLAWSADGGAFAPMGDAFPMVFQLKTFQGIRYGLFAYSAEKQGGYADFDDFTVDEPFAESRVEPIPFSETVGLALAGAATATGLSVSAGQVVAGEPAPLLVHDRGLGRVALEHESGFVTVDAAGDVAIAPEAGLASQFQWMEALTGEVVLMSLATNRFLQIDAASGSVSARSPGWAPDGLDGVRLDVERRDA